jgi:hypothetical protein
MPATKDKQYKTQHFYSFNSLGTFKLIFLLMINQGHKAEKVSVQLCISSQQAQIPDDHCAGPSPTTLAAPERSSFRGTLSVSKSDWSNGIYRGGT